MPYANNTGVKIYYEVEGQGPPLVLAHGLGGSGNTTWRMRGYADAMKNDFRLILHDGMGHGRSDKPHEASAYEVTKMASDVIAVLDDIGINQAHYFGHSVGTKVGYWLAAHYPERFLSFIFGGDTPYHDEGDVKTRQQSMEALNLLLKDPEAYLLRREGLLGRPLTSEEKESRLANDTRALITLLTAVDSWPSLTDYELSLIYVPCLILCGDLDSCYTGAKKAASHIPHAIFVSLPGVNHNQTLERNDLVLPIIKEFLAQVNRT